jgi:CheY-like chemotaxis protein
MDKILSPPSVFVVDDDVEDFEILSEFIHEKHPDVIVKHFIDPYDFVQALDFVLLPGLLVLDVNMPKLNGFDVFKRVKLLSRWKDVPVIFLTTSSHPKDGEKAMKLGSVNLYVKPITVEQWEQLIETIDSKVTF